MHLKRNLVAGLAIIGIVVAFFGIPLIPCFIVWSLVSPASDMVALATVFLCICIYIVAMLVELVLVVIAAASMQ